MYIQGVPTKLSQNVNDIVLTGSEPEVDLKRCLNKFLTTSGYFRLILLARFCWETLYYAVFFALAKSKCIHCQKYVKRKPYKNVFFPDDCTLIDLALSVQYHVLREIFVYIYQSTALLGRGWGASRSWWRNSFPTDSNQEAQWKLALWSSQITCRVFKT